MYKLVLFILFILILFSRLTPVLYLPYEGLISDDAMYMSMARSFYEGNLNAIIHPFWMPLYPLSSAFFFKFVQNWTFASVLTSSIFGAALLIPVYFVGKYYAGRLVGLLSVFFLIFYFPLVHASYTPYAESLQVFLFWMGVVFYLKALDSNKITFAILSGTFWGLTFLTRSEGLFTVFGLIIFNFLLLGIVLKKKFKVSDLYFKIVFFILFFGYLMNNYPYIGTNSLLGILISLLFFFSIILFLCSENLQAKIDLSKLSRISFITLIMILVFYFLYNGLLIAKYKKPLFSAKASAFLNPAGYYSLNKSGTSTWVQDLVSPETFNPDSEFISGKFYEAKIFNKQNPILDILQNTFFFLGKLFYFSSKTGLFLFFIGIYWLIFKTNDYYKKIFLFSMIGPAVFLLAIISIDPSERYLYFSAPIIPLGIAFGITYLANFFKSFKVKIPVLCLLIFLVLYFNLNQLSSRGESITLNTNLSEYIDLFIGEKARVYKENKEILALLRNKRIMGRRYGVGFNYRSFFIYSPTIKDFDELVSYAKRWKVDYIIANPKDVDFNFLYLTPKDYPGLKMELSLDSTTFLYKVIYNEER